MSAAPVGAAQATYEVEVGRFFDDSDHTAESMRFFPSSLRIHQGDTLHFTTGAFHGVTLMPVDVDPDQWIEDFMGGINKRFSAFNSDLDDGPQALKANPGALWPSAPCGWPTQPSCQFDGLDGEVLNSGVALFPQGQSAESMQLDFSVTINSDPGEVVTIADPLHPAMRMQVEVVGEDEAASDPAALEQANEDAFAADEATANKLHKKYSKKKASKKIKGKVYKTAWSGVETATVSLRRVYPSKIKIKAGQGVQWLFNKNVFSSHTVTFPAGAGKKIADSFPDIVCDPDGDSPELSEGETGAADTAPTSTSFPYCSNPNHLELDVPAEFPYAIGDGKYTAKKDFETSGVRGVGLSTDKSAYKLLFTKKSKKKGFPYMCMLHEIAHSPMRGKIVVVKKR